jgi:hypothetical protein
VKVEKGVKIKPTTVDRNDDERLPGARRCSISIGVQVDRSR